MTFKQCDYKYEKKLYMLIGPKGSGKTYIGKSIDKVTDIKFIHVEKIWINLSDSEDGWRKVEEKVDEEFKTNDHLIIENLGAGAEFNKFRKSLLKKYTVKMIKVEADPELCIERVKKRNKKEHIEIPLVKVREYNEISSKVKFEWDLIIDNNIKGNLNFVKIVQKI